MIKLKINLDEIQEFNDTEILSLPKYTSQIINLANQNAQATRPKNVGQMSELFPEFISHAKENKVDISIANWSNWYCNKYPNSIEKATEKIYDQIEKIKEATQQIDKEMVKNWVKDLLITKTYNGLFIQKIILEKVAKEKGVDYRLSTPDEETKGIDGFIGNEPYSIKPDSYDTKNMLNEEINVKIIYYKKNKTNIEIEFD